MYMGIDVGGTKTVVATLTQTGDIREQVRFPTPKDYKDFLFEVKKALNGFKEKDYAAGAAGIPVTWFDRSSGVAHAFGNLPWRDVPVQQDLERIFDCPFVVENDCKLAALSEAHLLKGKYSSVLYVTVSTGIGFGLVLNGVIDTSVGDGGGRTILLEHNGKTMPWEDFAGGRAINERFGKHASDITDDATWKIIAHDLAKGFIHLIAIMQPEVIVMGGSVGTYFDRYSKFLKEDIEKYQIPLIKLPDIRRAERPNEVVIYGCYDVIKQAFPHARAD
jgi:predicted NBD/HSP70 family sugar kinase